MMKDSDIRRSLVKRRALKSPNDRDVTKGQKYDILTSIIELPNLMNGHLLEVLQEDPDLFDDG